MPHDFVTDQKSKRRMLESEITNLACELFSHVLRLIYITPTATETEYVEDFTPDQMTICSGICAALKKEFPTFKAEIFGSRLRLWRPPEMSITAIEKAFLPELSGS